MAHPSLATFPMKIEIDSTISKVIFSQSDSGKFELHGMAGVTKETQEPVFIVATELPTSRQPPRSKQEQETGDVKAFLTAGGVPSFEVVPGPHKNDPPDCLVDVGDRRYAIETAQLLLPARKGKPNAVGRWKLFEQLRDQLFRQSGRLQSRLRQHRGYMVTVWFNMEDENRLPPRTREIDQMIDHLKAVRPPGKDLVAPSYVARLPNTIPPNTVMNQNDSKSVGCTWAALPPGVQSGLQRAIGFDLALAYFETYTQSMLRAELVRIIDQHDDPRSDILVLTVGADTREGIYFPSTRLFADAVFDDPDPLNGWVPQHLPLVAIHDARRGLVRWIHGDTPFA